MMNRFPDDWRDRREMEFRGSLKNIDISRLPDALIARIADGEHPLAVLASATPAALLPAPGDEKSRG